MSLFLHQCYLTYAPGVYVAELVMALTQNNSHAFFNPSFKFLYFVGGEGRLWIDGTQCYKVKAGDLMVIPTACHQRYEAMDAQRPSRLQAFVVRFDECHDESLARYLREVFSGILLGEGNLELWELFVRLRGSGALRLPIAWTRIKTFALVAAEALKRQRRPRLGWHQFEALASQWAAAPGFPPLVPEANPPFSEPFRQTFGMNPRCFAREMFIERAKVEMVYRSAPLSQIAHNLGFSSPSVFSRAFVQATGLSPSRFRKDFVFELQKELVPVSPKSGFSRALNHSSWACEVLSQPFEKTNDPVLFVGIKGQTEISMSSGVDLHLDETDLIFLPAGARWKHNAAGRESEMAVIRISAMPPLRKQGKAPRRLKPKRTLEIEMLRACLLSLLERPTLHLALRVQSLVELLLIEDSSNLTQKESKKLSKRSGIDAVAYTKEYLINNFASPLTLENIASHVGLSVEHLSRLFRAATGRTVFDFLKCHRLGVARRILQKSGQSISKVAEEAGFSSDVVFCRIFKAAEGVTPSAWRNAHRKSTGLHRNINHSQ